MDAIGEWSFALCFSKAKQRLVIPPPHSSETGVTTGEKMDLNLAIHPLNPTKVKLESKKTSPAFPRACQT